MREVEGSLVVAVFRRGVVVYLLTASIVVGLITISVEADNPSVGLFSIALWILFAIPALIWRRGAAIFTSDALWVRPCLGSAQKIPLKGVKRAYIHPGLTNEDGPTLRVVLLVGGEITISVPNM